MANVKLIAFDLDYTLLRTGGKLSDFTVNVLKKASDAGILLVPASGRGLCEMGELLPKMPVRYFVSVNGSVVWDLKKKEIIYRALPDQDKILEKIKLALSMKIYTEVYCGEVYTDAYSYENMEALGMPKDQIPMFRATRTVVDDLYVEMKKLKQVEKLHVIFRDVPDKLNRQEPFLHDPNFAYTAAFINNLELSGPQVDKGTGLSALASILDIAPEHVMTLGDGANDVPMLSWAGLGVAMANAVPEAKKVADVLTDTNDEDGAAKAILKWALNNN